MEDFTNKLVVSEILNCAACKGLLKLPIHLVKDLGNVCGNCSLDYNGIHNVALENILTELRLPCRFLTSGCPDRSSLSDLGTHEKNCRFLEKPCFLEHQGCAWKGSVSEFPAHFINTHPEHVLSSNNLPNSYTLDPYLDNSGSITKLLKAKKKAFIQIQRQNNTYRHVLYSMGEDLEFNLKYIGPSGNKVEFVLKSANLGTDPESAVEIDSAALVQVIGVSKVMQVQLNLITGATSSAFDEKMLQFFECPVCKMLMRPPIYQCKFGHSFCNQCRPRLERCPNCRGNFETTRNYSLEGLTSSIPYSCMYNHLGCEETLTANDSNKHEAVCAFKPFPCPFDNCMFTGSQSNIGIHLEEKHTDKILRTDFYKTTIEFRSDNISMDLFEGRLHVEKTYFLVFEGNMFRLNFKKTLEYSFWAVELLRKQNPEDVFVYEIGIIDMRKPDRKLIRCDLCFTDITQEDLFKKCIMFSNNTLVSYSYNGMMTYYCKVSKRQQ